MGTRGGRERGREGGVKLIAGLCVCVCGGGGGGGLSCRVGPLAAIVQQYNDTAHK